MPEVTIETVGNNGFPVAQIGDFIHLVNFWGVNLALNDAYGSWTVAAGAQINSQTYEAPTQAESGPSIMSWRIRDTVFYTGGQNPTADTSRVYAYPNILFGSLGGRKEVWGYSDGRTPILPGGENARNADHAYDMRVPNAAIGLPAKVSDINTLSFKFDIDKEFSGATGNFENVFIDTYVHRIHQPALWPNPYDSAWGDLNKINENNTETWNLNFKLALPEFSIQAGAQAGAQATGGLQINQGVPIVIGGREWGVYLKWENIGGGQPRDVTTGVPANGLGANSFFYISFIPWSAATGADTGVVKAEGYEIDYKAHLDWVASQEFKDRVLGQNGFSPVAGNRQGSGQQANWPLWLWQQNGEPPFMVDDDSIYVLDGIGLGNELWFSPTDEIASVKWDNIEFTTDRGVFGFSDSPTGPIGGGGGSGSGTTITIVAPTTDAEFAAWRADRSNEPYRIFLAELDHSFGTVRLGSKAWLSDVNLPYDASMPKERTPFLESSVSNIITVGDLTATNIDSDEVDWLSLDWFGHRSRWYYGDERWRFNEFRTIATSTIQTCRFIGSGTYQFDLLSDTAKYNQSFLDRDRTFRGTAEEVLIEVFDEANSVSGAEVGTFEVVGDIDLTIELEFSANENTTLDNVIRTICLSLNARRRISQNGALQVVSRVQSAESQFEFYDDIIDSSSIRMVSTRNPAAFVRVTYNDGDDSVDVPTFANINGLQNVAMIDTYLARQVDAVALGEIEAVRYRQARRVWEMEVSNNLEQNSVVDQGVIDHPSVSGFGEITRIRRQPLSEATRIEVEV